MQGLLLLAVTALAGHAQTADRIQDVIYLKQGGCAFTMDVFKPKTSNHKAVIWMVSGGWVSGQDSILPAAAKPLTDRGFTVFEVVHGSQPKFVVSEIVMQIRRAVRFVRSSAKTYDINPDAIGISGASSGGHLSLEVAGLGDDGNAASSDPIEKISSRINAVVAFMPPTDFEDWGTPNTPAFGIPNLQVFMPAFGITATTSAEEKQKIAHILSPKTFLSASFPPTLLVHGDADDVVPLQQSKDFDKGLGDLKVDHKLLIVEGGKHDGNAVFKYYDKAVDWFDAHLPAPKKD